MTDCKCTWVTHVDWFQKHTIRITLNVSYIRLAYNVWKSWNLIWCSTHYSNCRVPLKSSSKWCKGIQSSLKMHLYAWKCFLGAQCTVHIYSASQFCYCVKRNTACWILRSGLIFANFTAKYQRKCPSLKKKKKSYFQEEHHNMTNDNSL